MLGVPMGTLVLGGWKSLLTVIDVCMRTEDVLSMPTSTPHQCETVSLLALDLIDRTRQNVVQLLL